MGGDTRGFTVWITGLPFSGKKDVAALVKMRLAAIGIASEILAGGHLRHLFEDRLGFSEEQVAHNLRRISFEAQLLAEAGTVAIVVAISFRLFGMSPWKVMPSIFLGLCGLKSSFIAA